MRNCLRSSGVYTNMLRMPLFLICSLAALAQDPFDAANQTFWEARNQCRFEAAAAAREQARALLLRVPVDSPRFAGWVQQVVQLYQNSNRNAQARAVLAEALDRTRPLGDGHPTRIAMLNGLADSWQQDGNLLKAVAYLEQAVTAQAKTPPDVAAQPGTRQIAITGRICFGSRAIIGYPRGQLGRPVDRYIRLAGLYRQLGRRDAVAAVAEKIRGLASTDQAALVQFYEQQGQLDEAAAVCRKLAEQ